VPERVGSVLGRWPELVGPDIAARCRPESLRDGDLVLVAESTAWATQLRLMAPALLATLRERVGAEVVRRVTVRGPTAPDWRHGARRVAGGRGPRDTYG
jgi:predicted nucleic acid-binding Zn ribbon protein